eukprot:2713400-Prymnesium_polylepis.1
MTNAPIRAACSPRARLRPPSRLRPDVHVSTDLRDVAQRTCSMCRAAGVPQARLTLWVRMVAGECGEAVFERT